MRKIVLPLAAAAAFAASLGVPAARADNLNIATAGPMTGEYAAFGEQMKRGAEMAVKDINAKGGVNGKTLALTIGDDACDPKQAVAVANDLVSKGVVFVAGHFCSGSSIPASSVYHDEGVLQITPASTNPKFTDDPAKAGWGTVFRTCGRDDQQGGVAGKYLAENYKSKKIAIVHDKTTYGKGLADETKKALNGAGVREVLYEGLNVGEKDYSAIVSKIKASGADVVFFGGVHTEAGLLVRQMRDQGVQAPLMGGDGIASEEFASIAGPGADGTLMTFPPDPRLRPEAAEVVKKFEAKKFNPETYTLYSYAAVQVLKQAAEQAKSIDTQAMIDVMHSGKPFKTVIGDIAYDKKGDVTRADYVVYRWQKGADGKITYKQL